MDCLITKLKGFANASIPNFGILKLQADADNVSVFYLFLDGTVKMTVTNGHFTNSIGESDYGTNMTKTDYTGYIYITEGATLSVDAHKTTGVIISPQGSASVCITDTMQLSHCINLKDVEIQGNTTGDILYLSKLSALETLKISTTSISGDLSSLLPIKSTLKTIELPKSVSYTEYTLSEFTSVGCSVIGGTLIVV